MRSDAVFDVAIGGGGTVGLALACALADALGAGARIALVDRGALSAAGGRDIRASALSAGSKRLLATLGVWPAIAEAAQPVTAIDITDSRLSDAIRPILLSYDNTLAAAEPASYIVENERLRQALVAAAAARPAIALMGCSPIDGFVADAGGVSIRLANATLRAPLLVGADGRASRLRDDAGIKILRWSYPQTGIVTTVDHSKPHHGRALQHFLPSGPFAILPLTHNRSCITWTEATAGAQELLALEAEGFRAELARRFDYRLGEIVAVGARAAWPLDMHLARALVGERFALIGDAARVVHPIAGQGLNLGLRDVAALTEVIADAARLGLDTGAQLVLERYERWRRLDSALSAATYDALNGLFSNDWTLLRTARDFGLAVLDQLPVLKQFLVAEAAGVTGEVPKLLRGERP
ncbi:MAG TPA: FAD-dependent monooxygenase [Hyphomicrobiaceae bacterium]|jgi:2-octaprenyl-6-methoxyphenol hydroxylase|nr:FAD-dependent monooxygenase [Hyphomicrobiaceae bacterium]